MKKYLLLSAVLLVSPALAQQPTQLDQRIASQIGTLVIQNTSQGVQIETLQAQLATVQARVKELEAKYEPKPEAAK